MFALLVLENELTFKRICLYFRVPLGEEKLIFHLYESKLLLLFTILENIELSYHLFNTVLFIINFLLEDIKLGIGFIQALC